MLNCRCKESKMSLYAEVHPPTLYEAPAQLNTSGPINTTMAEELRPNSTAQTQPPSAASPPSLHTPWTSSRPTSITHVSALAAGLETSPTSNPPLSDPRGIAHRDIAGATSGEL